MNKIHFSLLFMLVVLAINAQSIDEIDPELINWINKDIEEDDLMGASVDKTYQEFIKDKPAKKVIVVAVLDSGFDTNHVDMKGKYWRNPNEIPHNGIDDDGNGYVDDLYGWNFLGNSKGENLHYETLECTRVYASLKNRYEDVDPTQILESEKLEYGLYIQAMSLYEKELEKRLKTRENLTRLQPVDPGS